MSVTTATSPAKTLGHDFADIYEMVRPRPIPGSEEETSPLVGHDLDYYEMGRHFCGPIRSVRVTSSGQLIMQLHWLACNPNPFGEQPNWHLTTFGRTKDGHPTVIVNIDNVRIDKNGDLAFLDREHGRRGTIKLAGPNMKKPEEKRTR